MNSLPRLEHSAVEFNLAEHCNLTCGGCNHASPLLPRKLASLSEFVRDVTALASVLHAGELRLVGGEPMLHPRWLDFLREGCRSDLADRLAVYTNGTLLHKAPEELYRLVDRLWVSVYPGARLTVSLADVAERCREHGVEYQERHIDQFTLTLLNDRIEDSAVVEQVYRACDMAHGWSCHAIHEGRFYKCPLAPFSEARLALAGVDFRNKEQDGVRLHDNPDLREELEHYLRDERPLAACAYCLGNHGPVIDHRLLDRRGLEAWRRDDHRAEIAAWRPPAPRG